MKKVILLFWILPVLASGQVSYNFETASLSGWIQSIPGHWSPDSATAISGSFSLHHSFDNPEAGEDQIGLRLKGLLPSAGTAKWKFLVRHGTDPSSSNCWAVFIMADNGPSGMMPGGNINGFATGVNLNGYDDTLRLYKVKSGVFIPVIASGLNWQNDIGTSEAVLIEVDRSIAGEWTLKVSKQTGGPLTLSKGNDPDLFGIHWLGVFYKYTSSRDRLLWLDDISVDGIFAESPEPPDVAGVIPAGDSLLHVSFKSDISELSAAPPNFSCEPFMGDIVKVTMIDSRTLELSFNDRFINKSKYSLTCENICDADSVCADIIKAEFVYARADPGDIIISEIMADPLPGVSLPEREYIELLNRSGFNLNLKNWKLVTTASESIFPDVQIAPDEIIIVCPSSDSGSFSNRGRTTGLRNFPPLNDEGRTLVIVDDKGVLIHGVPYVGSWYNDKIKSQGGWSLEMIDTGFPFFYEGNWTASVSNDGGTPGKRNSVDCENPDLYFAGLLNAFPYDSNSVLVTFSEPVKDPGSLLGKISISGMKADRVIMSDLLGMEYTVLTDKPLSKDRFYSISLMPGLTDFAGNPAIRKSYIFGLPGETTPNDVRFNEILFNPYPGEYDFIELVNCSRKIINPNRLYIVSVNDETMDTSSINFVSDTGRCFIPGAYYAITEARDALLNRYNLGVDSAVFQVSHLPSMPDDKGHLIMYNQRAEKIDEIRYSEKMHFQLLSGSEGISLEKIRPESSSMEEANWHSASESSGWATPGSVNSSFAEIPETTCKITFSSTRITPDNDGYEDFLVMDLILPGNSNVISIQVFDENGSMVRRLLQNFYAGNKLSTVWDGSSDQGSVLNSGIYIILITGFNESGKTYKWKKVCALVR